MTDLTPSTDKSSDLAASATLETIRKWGQEMGFQALGFTGIDLAQHSDYLAKWLLNYCHNKTRNKQLEKTL